MKILIEVIQRTKYGKKPLVGDPHFLPHNLRGAKNERSYRQQNLKKDFCKFGLSEKNYSYSRFYGQPLGNFEKSKAL